MHRTAGSPCLSADYQAGPELVRVCDGPGTRETGICRDALKLKASVDPVDGIRPYFDGNNAELVGIVAKLGGHFTASVGLQRREGAGTERTKTPCPNWDG
ncbi:hypothetical protein [Arthrobacter sp. ERGS1:01]|uniref:hypothetical protein n=1 Tax=Arthrobacter sp. ERGS1:01 TaxID=1704044 RepID=UPI000AD95277|nr:hypothetical protein [Arthrobacter sp. ERGS1:01]